jgi:hypothetical protein
MTGLDIAAPLLAATPPKSAPHLHNITNPMERPALQWRPLWPSGVDLPAIEQDLRGLYRSSVTQFSRLEQAWSPLAATLGDWFEKQLTCW